MTRRPRPAVRRGAAAAALLALLPLAAACGSEPTEPTGVDELVLPDAGPDPDDFVAGVDNPWLPLEPGAAWAYEVTGGPGGGVLVEVLEEPVEVAGIGATAVETTATFALPVAGEPLTGWTTGPTTDYYAQDTRGNVWWLGREGEWEVGVDGAAAGLAVPAEPRLGDGFRQALAEGVQEEVAQVVALSGSVAVPAGTYDDVLVLEVRDPLDGSVRRVVHARGAGPVLDETTTGAGTTLSLASYDD